MIIDALMELSDEQALTVTAVSTNVIDLQAAGDAGTPLDILVTVDEAFTAGGAATLTIDLQTATDEVFTSPVVMASTGPIAVADLTLNSTHFTVPMPDGALQYLRMNYTVSTGPFTAGKISATFTPSRQTNGV